MFQPFCAGKPRQCLCFIFVAVENQATDRAHRIGQVKPVFVYKLIAKGTLEERIVELQAKKGALAAGLLDGDAHAASALNAKDLQALFEPMPE